MYYSFRVVLDFASIQEYYERNGRGQVVCEKVMKYKKGDGARQAALKVISKLHPQPRSAV